MNVSTEFNSINGVLVPLIYLISATLFILGLKRMGRISTARSGNTLSAFAMFLAVIGTLLEIGFVDYRWIIGGLIIGGLIGTVAALRVRMTEMPEMVALFNGSGGAASLAVAVAVVWSRIVEQQVTSLPSEVLGVSQSVTVGLSIIIGAVTLSGSYMAYLKLQGKINKGRPILLPLRHVWTAVFTLGALALSIYFAFFAADAAQAGTIILIVAGASLVLGVLLVIPIGSGDMPVVVSLLNSYSGLAACATGFMLNNNALIISGALVGSAGIILTQIMCVAMDRSLLNVLLGGFGAQAATSGSGASDEYTSVTSSSAEEMAMVLFDSESVVFVPGYGLAVAQAQHAVRELTDLLTKKGIRVSFAIHPVAGRMPGHMNVLLAEADVPYDYLFEMEKINSEFKSTDVAILLGANDVCNPSALDDPSSPIYGMPILNVHQSRSVFIVKRSLSPGYAGIKNPLFEAENASMCYGDAKKIINEVIEEIKTLK
ncbi:MAG: NAD(P)(+) transhydrogenase (Re/Si-specific) subunit beta [Cyclobacteriaceae bacterium]|nr:NAD(P)(+) transhydrogenase (Re/Si-specific) subunit beta [Cyclobacteriaceae bacterium]